MIAVLILLIAFSSETFDQLIQEGNASVQKGNEAKTYEDRKRAYNQALYLYSIAEQKTVYPSESLNLAIGDLYFQLGEYPWAILYYERILKHNTQVLDAVEHLKKAEAKLGIASKIDRQQSSKFLQSLISLSRSRLLLWTIIVTFMLCSLAIWLPRRFIQLSAITTASLLLMLFLIHAALYYSAPLEGILVASTGFYRTPGTNQPQLSAAPLPAGSKVKALQTAENGNWLKIEDQAGVSGYIPADHFQLI